MKNAAGYIRVSTHSQEELSPDAQRRLLHDYATKHDMLLTDDLIFEEGGISGKRADRRPQFQQMIATAKSKEHPIDAILVWKFSRFARNQEESIVYKSLLKKANVEVISVSEPLVDGPFGSLIERIIEWMDEYYSIRLSGEVTRGMTEKAIRGGYQARPPLGYAVVEKGKPPKIVESEAAIIRSIYNMFLVDDMSLFNIARHLNDAGIQTQRGGGFEYRSIDYILRNPTYKGYIRWNRTENETNRIKDKEEWIITKGHHEAIIPEDMWDEVQKKLDREVVLRPRKSRPPEQHKHWLSGILRCGACGRTMSCHCANRNGKLYYQFKCYAGRKGKCSKAKNLSAMHAVPVILDGLKRFLYVEDFDFEIKSPEVVTNTVEIDLYTKQLEGLDKKETRIKEAYLAEIDTLEEYKENKLLLARERQRIQKLIEKSRERGNVAKNKQEMRQEISRRVKNIIELLENDEIDMEVKGKALRSVVEKIVYNYDEETLDIYVYYS